jgi:hypothetical protein
MKKRLPQIFLWHFSLWERRLRRHSAVELANHIWPTARQDLTPFYHYLLRLKPESKSSIPTPGGLWFMSQPERLAPPTAVFAVERDFRLRQRLRRDTMACQVGGVPKTDARSKMKTLTPSKIPQPRSAELTAEAPLRKVLPGFQWVKISQSFRLRVVRK